MKIAVIFPGIGYTCDKPLLYFAAKLAKKYGYEVKRVEYGNFPKKVKGNRVYMEQSFESAKAQTKEILKDIRWSDYEDILFISKSIGTIVAAHYIKKHHLNEQKTDGRRVRSISFTPLADTFVFAEGDGIMFHGTSDPWVDNSDDIIRGCEKIGQPLYLTDDGNHSLETGNVMTDIANLSKIMDVVDSYIASTSEPS